MKPVIHRAAYVVAVLAICVVSHVVRAADDPLPSWNEGPAKQAIVILFMSQECTLNDFYLAIAFCSVIL